MGSVTSWAGIVIDVSEVGDDVVFTGSGSIVGLSLFLDNGNTLGPLPPAVNPSLPNVVLGPTGILTYDVYVDTGGAISVSGPFGSGGLTQADSGSGAAFGISNGFVSAPFIQLAVPAGYVDGQQLVTSATYLNTDLATLGLNEGTYVYSWGAGATADSVTVNVVPEPSSMLLLIVAGISTIFGQRRRY